MYRIAVWSTGAVLLGVLVLGGAGVLLRQRVLAAVAATTVLKDDIVRQDVRGGCLHIAQASAAWNNAARLSDPLAPWLHRLGWVPRIGSDLALVPDLVTLAQHGSAAGDVVCPLVLPVYDANTTPQRMRVAAEQLQQHQAQLTMFRDHLAQVQAAWLMTAPRLAQSRYLAPYRDQLDRAGEHLPLALQGATIVEQAGPQVGWLLGIDAPRRFLLVSQNPFELRPTGGFLGIACVVEVRNAHARVDSCHNSAAYDAVAPAGSPMPDGYHRYLRLSEWRLRDANWSPDFPTSARRIEWFWTINGQLPVDGVVAVDPYALVPLLQVIGPLTLAGGTSVGADHVVDTILAEYYDGAVFADKDRLGALLPLVLQRAQQVNVTQFPGVAQALRQALDERHVQVWLHNQAIQTLLAQQRWDGGMHVRDENTLRVVDADVGYGDVNAFVERLTQHDVALSEDGVPLTTTLTLTYTNRYSPWVEAPTSHAAYGNCADPRTLQQHQITGCYADYLRVYVPHGSQLLGIDGVDASLGAQLDNGRTVFGGYLRVDPGQQRVVHVQYRVPNGSGTMLAVEKQGGTLAPPWLFTAHTPTKQAALWTNGATDRTLRYRVDTANIAIDGAPADATVAETWARHAAFVAGLAQWNTGDQAAALETWQRGHAVSAALDHAYGRAQAGATTDAQALFAALDPLAEDGRAAFEQAVLLDAQHDDQAADRLYEAAARRSPDQPLAQLRWASRLAQRGQSFPDLRKVAGSSAGVRRWRQAVDTLAQQGALHDAVLHADVLLRVTPDDHAVALHAADLLVRLDWAQQALARYNALAAAGDVWGMLAGARAAQLQGDLPTAATRYAQALERAATFDLIMEIGNGLRDAGDTATALHAYERAAAIEPQQIWPLLAAGDVLRTTDPVRAREWYERAQTVAPHNGAPDWSMGTLLLDAGDTQAALPYLEQAVRKQPDMAVYQETLARVRAQVDRAAHAAAHP